MRGSWVALAAMAFVVGCDDDDNDLDALAQQGDYSAEFGIVTDGRITGGGSVFTRTGQTNPGMRVTHGFELHCDGDDPNTLEINWEGNQFHLDGLTYQDCTENPAYDSGNPNAPLNQYYGEGFGSFNREDGYTIFFVIIDDGEPGTTDEFSARIYDPNGMLVLQVGGQLTFGNHQAHRDNQGGSM